MQILLKRVIANRSYCNKFTRKWTGTIFTIWSIVALFTPFDDLMNNINSWLVKLFVSLLIVLTVFICIYTIGAFIVLNTDMIELLDAGDNHHVYVQYGDVFSPEVLGKNANCKKRNILISANRCFDTIVDDNLITSNSLHGAAMNILYTDRVFTQDTLNKAIQKQIRNMPFITVDKTQKPSGNQKKYAEGTIAEITASPDVTFFFLGLTSFDAQLHPYITNVEYVTALSKALKYCMDRNQGYPVIIPLIGGGRSETKKEEEDILKFLVKLIKLNKQSINCDIHIIIRNSAKETTTITDLE